MLCSHEWSSPFESVADGLAQQQDPGAAWERLAVDDENLVHRAGLPVSTACPSVLERIGYVSMRRSAVSRSGTTFWAPTTQILWAAPPAYAGIWLPVFDAAASEPVSVTAATLPTTTCGAAGQGVRRAGQLLVLSGKREPLVLHQWTGGGGDGHRAAYASRSRRKSSGSHQAQHEALGAGSFIRCVMTLVLLE
jgi:hypothetical protein